MSLRVWLLSHGEILPCEEGHRPMRTAMLGEELRSRGHAVTWWTSTFSHPKRRLIATEDLTTQCSNGICLELLHAGSYRKTVSLARHHHNQNLAKRFIHKSKECKKPDIIVASYPIIEFAAAGVRYAVQNDIPVVVDVRDFWPDLYLDRVPAYLRTVARVMLTKTFREAKETLSAADSIIAMSQGVLCFGLGHASRKRSMKDKVFPLGCRDLSSENQKTKEFPDINQNINKPITITFVGSFGTSYDLETVVEAAKRINSKTYGLVQFKVVGGGDQEKLIRNAAASLENVEYAGWLQPEEIAHVLSESDIGLLPLITRPGAMPNKFFEYLRAGLPIISSVEGEVETIIKNNHIGWKYTSKNLDSLVNTIEKVIQHRSDFRFMAERARELFKHKYDATQVYQRYAEHLERLV